MKRLTYSDGETRVVQVIEVKGVYCPCGTFVPMHVSKKPWALEGTCDGCGSTVECLRKPGDLDA